MDRIREISENITPSKSLKETIQQIETEYRMEKFHKIEMSEFRRILKRMENKESNIDGITVKLLKHAFENIIKQSFEQVLSR